MIFVDKLPDITYSTIPWGWHPGHIGLWELEIPLSREKVDVFGYGVLLDVLENLFGIAGDFFYPAQVECPPGYALFDYTLMLPPMAIRLTLDRLWSAISFEDRNYSPGCDVCGVSCVFVNSNGKAVKAAVPNSIRVILDSDLVSDKPLARLAIATKCDVWLERTVGGEDNTLIGGNNGAILSDKLRDIEAGLCGRISRFSTDFRQVEIDRYGIRYNGRNSSNGSYDHTYA